MAYTPTYQQLIADILLWTQEQGDEFQEQIDAIIPLAELRLLRDLGLLRFRDIVAAPAVTIGISSQTRVTTLITEEDAYYAIANGRIPVLKRSLAFIIQYATSAAPGPPKYWAEISETTYALAPLPDISYPMRFFGIVRPAGITESNPTSWLSLNVGDLLLKSCLIEAEQYLVATAPVAKWKAEYSALLLPAKREFGSMSMESFLGS